MSVAPCRDALVCMTALALARCGGDRSRSPTCGLAQIAGPTLIQQQLVNAPYVITDGPRGLPSTLPARVAGLPQQGAVSVAYADSRLVMEYRGPTFPAGPEGYGLLVVDDSSQRAQGVLIYVSPRPPSSYPQLGDVTGGDRSIPLYGVRVDWGSVSNPRCPLLGAAALPPK